MIKKHMLNTIRVIELANYIAAPSAGGLLADWGAEVIKIESQAGCPMRHAFSIEGKRSPVFDVDNRNKQCITLDLSKPKAIDILKQLLGTADVFLTNLRYKSLSKMGLAYPDLKKLFPKLVYAEVTGYGVIGPDKDLPGFDVSAFFARSSMLSAATPKTSDPVYPRTAVGDHMAGVSTTAGILAALLQRERSGKGCFVDCSLLRSGIYALSSDLSLQMAYGRLGSSKPRDEVREPIANFFKTKDERWLTIVPRPVDEREWRNLCRIIGAEDLSSNPDYDHPKKRRALVADIVKRFDACFAQKTMAEWAPLLDEEGIVWAPLLKPSEVIEDEQAKQIGAFIELESEDGESHRSIAGPVRFVDCELPKAKLAREIGADNETIFSQLGYSAQDIDEMKKQGVF